MEAVAATSIIPVALRCFACYTSFAMTKGRGDDDLVAKLLKIRDADRGRYERILEMLQAMLDGSEEYSEIPRPLRSSQRRS